MITLYDIPCRFEGTIWSPNTIKARIVLNYKNLEYQTEWVEYPDIEVKLKSIGGLPTSKTKPDGSNRDHYTLPAIHDTLTNAVVTDSFLIAEYLEKTYPDSPRIFPLDGGSKASILMLQAKFMGEIMKGVMEAIIPKTASILTEKSEKYFRETREAMLFGGRKLEDVLPKDGANDEGWVAMRNRLKELARLYARNGENGLYFFGELFSYADVITMSSFVWIQVVFGKVSEEWREIESVAGGFWKKQVEANTHLLTVK